MITEERRRKIVEITLMKGSVRVAELASALKVAENTIRSDLSALDKAGKLARAYGGAIIREKGKPALPYAETRDANRVEKTLIAKAAADYLPSSGSIFINAGSTTAQLIDFIRPEGTLEATTNSPEHALRLMQSMDVQLVGGKLIRESAETDGAYSLDFLSKVYWDAAFMGLTAVDKEHGITSINLACAELERNVMKQSRLVVGLCDSSKLGRFARALTGPITLLHVLITDSKAEPNMIKYIKSKGIKIIVVGETNG